MKALLKFIVIYLGTCLILATILFSFAFFYFKKADDSKPKQDPSSYQVENPSTTDSGQQIDDKLENSAESPSQQEVYNSTQLGTGLSQNMQDSNGNWKYIDKYCNPMPADWSPIDMEDHNAHLNPNFQP